MIILFLTFDTEEEKEKFSEIYQDHAEFMMRVARRILQNSQDAEDVIQDAFLYVADHLEKINQFDRQKTRSYSGVFYAYTCLRTIVGSQITKREPHGLSFSRRRRDLNLSRFSKIVENRGFSRLRLAPDSNFDSKNEHKCSSQR